MKKKLTIKDFERLSAVQKIQEDKLKNIKGGGDGCPPPINFRL